MQEFKIRGEIIQQQKQKSIRIVRLVLAAILGFFAVIMLMDGLDVLVLVSLVVMGLIMFGTAALLFRFFPYEKLYTAYVRVYPEQIEVKINGFTPLMKVRLDEVRGIEDSKDYLFLRKQRGAVIIPKSLENYEALEGLLRERIIGQAHEA